MRCGWVRRALTGTLSACLLTLACTDERAPNVVSLDDRRGAGGAGGNAASRSAGGDDQAAAGGQAAADVDATAPATVVVTQDAGVADDRGQGGAPGSSMSSGTGTGGAVGTGGAASNQGQDTPTSCLDPLLAIDTSDIAAAERFVIYDIEGDSEADLRSALTAQGPGAFDAYTSWQLTWSFDFTKCDGSGLVVTADVEYTLPRWVRPASPDPALVTKWEAYVDALWCHEYGHGEFGLNAANAAYDALSMLEPAGDCQALQQDASAVFQATISDYVAAEVQYDVDTDHGKNEGARFP